MAGQFCVSLTHSKDNTDKATVAFVIANAGVGSDQDTLVFLSTEGVRLAVNGYAADIHEGRLCAAQGTNDQFCRSRRHDLRVLALL